MLLLDCQTRSNTTARTLGPQLPFISARANLVFDGCSAPVLVLRQHFHFLVPPKDVRQAQAFTLSDRDSCKSVEFGKDIPVRWRQQYATLTFVWQNTMLQSTSCGGQVARLQPTVTTSLLTLTCSSRLRSSKTTLSVPSWFTPVIYLRMCMSETTKHPTKSNKVTRDMYWLGW